MELLTKLGIEWRLLVAQIVNFLILMGVLYKFAYKPVLKHLSDRSSKIAGSLEKARQIDEDFKTATLKREVLLTEAKKQAAAILTEAQGRGDKMYKEKIAQTTAEAKQIVDRAKAALQEEKAAAVREAKNEIAELVVSAAAKVLEKTGKEDDKFIEQMLHAVK
ncbi:F0F1 ATP synthase subunit B [Candidatus Uhrbacteria bacterium]|nr:F0F1 ATP synthase subunit B [Candidatus Uhrbacteria bacterium]